MDCYQANAVKELLLEILHATDVEAMQQFFLMDVLNDEKILTGKLIWKKS